MRQIDESNGKRNVLQIRKPRYLNAMNIRRPPDVNAKQIRPPTMMGPRSLEMLQINEHYVNFLLMEQNECNSTKKL